ncbi:MAG TPA: class I SAM-dependent methyltransferase [Myxococcota bacterium]|nr:class I SAM-dependent methyltransferase [Myxococcota bacterium]
MPNDIFSGRINDYVQFRLDYPPELGPFLDQLIRPEFIVADIGSGSGLLTHWFLDRGLSVFGVEPNKEMRAAAEKALASYPSFHSIDGSAEHTTLQDQSIDLIACGNAFHWFDVEKTKLEWKRILKPKAHVLLIRSDWKQYPNAAMKAYDHIIMKYCTKRRGMVSDPKLEKAAIKNFFASCTFEGIAKREYAYTYTELVGRFLSTSFAPKAGHPEHQNALLALSKLFEDFAINSLFPFGTITTAVYGVL